jgi:DNA-binding response OmpR family regulator
MPATVLIVASDKTTTAAIAESFNRKDYAVVTAHSGRQALAQARLRLPDAIIVDATSSRLSVKRLLRMLRAQSQTILIVLAQNPNRFEALNGNSVVLPKTTTSRKLTQRLRTALDNRPPREMRLAGMTVNMEKRRITRGNKSHRLTPKEFELLKFFMQRPGQVISRRTLMKEIWDTDYLGDTRTLDVHIRWLREKIEDDPNEPCLLLTLRGQGYKLDVR